MAYLCLRNSVCLLVGLISTIRCASGVPAKCPKTQHCIAVSRCKTQDSDTLLYPCHSGLNMICCPSGSYILNSTLETRKTSLFPSDCGLVMNSDKISGGKKADLGQFPWMALLGYRQRGINYTQFLCGGSIITDSYVLTAAHCIHLDRRLELVVVRIGEHDLLSERDCIKVDTFEACAEPHTDFSIKQVTTHPNYNDQNLQNDIALVNLKQKIKFTDYVRPICLPFERNLETQDLAKHKLTVSGWGKTNANNLGGSSSLQYAVVTVWNQTACVKKVPPDVQPIRNTQLCANGPAKEDSCKGDSGGPLVNATADGGGDLRYFQIGIVSFASTLTCGDPNLPTVYTRVDKYLGWIEDNIS